jgi:hypothetical protein
MAKLFDLSVVLENQLSAFLELRRAVVALQVALESSVPGFQEKYGAALKDPKVAESARLNPAWVTMAQKAFLALRKA